ncbi:AraC family transcriptional regulator [Xanthobacter agilis]|uniref:AraC-like DNA-binding protein n=1 Tax=Xanthobacter agilis TaxID=47492 RepID=A0ABU0LHM9_XANAG|nr:AraC family transcriptional regulator [Xanthobacter agilis]MDQ0506629.1 AraC-like DNA-binding protein [Xanthobacter agilis]
MRERLATMCDIVERHAVEERQPTPVEGLTLFRMRTSLHPLHVLYYPRLCIILHGSKSVSLGDAAFDIDPRTFFLVAADLPVASRVFVASDGRPHLALTLDLDRVVLAQVLRHLPARAVPGLPPAGLVTAPMRLELLEPLGRLLALLDRPDALDFLRPLILQELYFHLLRSPLGDTLVQFAMGGSRLSQIGRATDWIKARYAEPVSIEALAELAGMSVTSFHRHFKAVTLMTPLQYRTQIRLQEARRLLLAERLSAGAAGLAVGYDSQSQFSRDYKRMFGTPPASDTARLVAAQA